MISLRFQSILTLLLPAALALLSPAVGSSEPISVKRKQVSHLPCGRYTLRGKLRKDTHNLPFLELMSGTAWVTPLHLKNVPGKDIIFKTQAFVEFEAEIFSTQGPRWAEVIVKGESSQLQPTAKNRSAMKRVSKTKALDSPFELIKANRCR